MAISVTLKSTGTKRTASGRSAGRSKGRLINVRPKYPYFVMCVDNDGYEPSLWIGKVYRVIRPEPLDGPNHLRVIDEEGEDYLYGAKRFVRIEIPSAVARKALVENASRLK